MNNLYLLCTNFIQIVVFNKDMIDIYNMNCILRFQVVGKFPIVTFYSNHTSLNNCSALQTIISHSISPYFCVMPYMLW
ncbi:hypothetical protein C1645_686210 [Glomus cerebriforme]|uniref:Uncharacterized protein n=1 Tax=Glomus cerebriforme TaxID=658196 RepID=A0A397TNH9_9GLOM|nr:hypothetical protein C1645_686210 [Glomus cerebriforme]